MFRWSSHWTLPEGWSNRPRKSVQAFYRSPVPTVVFVSPAGATATSAGCFITIAAHIAAMAPNTSIGAAHPVAMGGGGGGGQQDEVMKEKLANFASSYIQSIAEKRGRNAEWAIALSGKAPPLRQKKALELNVVDLLAEDLARSAAED